MNYLKQPFLLFPFILVFYEISNYLSNDMYLPALPMISEDFNISAHLAQMTLTVWFLGAASLQLILGPASDRWGRRPVLLSGGIIFIIATVICAVASTIQVFLIARFFQGCAICAIGTAGYSSIHECFDQKQAIKILAIMGSVTVLAPAFGPLAGSLILQWFTWRFIFGFLAAWAFLAVLLLWLKMPESLAKDKRHLIDWGLILKNYYYIISNPIFMFNTLIFCFSFLGMIAWIAAGPFLVIDRFHQPTYVFGIFQAMVFGGLIIGAQSVKYLIDFLGAKKLIDIGLTISLVGSIVACIIGFIFPQFLLGLIISLMLFTFGSSLAFSPSHRIAIESCSEPMGVRMAVFSSLMSFFGFMGGLLVSMTYNGSLAWMGCLMLIAIILAWICKIKVAR